MLASIKSALNVLKFSLSLQKRIDFFSLSHEALDLISQLETIQSGDQMVRDSKSSIRREIGRFLELVDEICAKRNTISLKTVKQIRIARNDDKSRVSNAGRESSGAYHRNKASKQRSADSDEKKLIDNLRERVERIQHISKVLKNEEDEDSADSDDGNGVTHSKIHTGKHRVKSHPEKHVWFAEDGNPTQVHDIHEDEKVPVKRVSGNAERNEKSVDESESDAESAEGSEFEDGDQNDSVEGSSQCSEGEERRKVNKPRHVCQDGKLILSAPPPVKMEGRMV